MLRLLADENLHGAILAGLLNRVDVDIVRVQDLPIAGEDDATILQWAAENDRIIVTHDRQTIPDHAFERLAAGERMRGIFVLKDRMAIGSAITELLLVAACTEQQEWSGCVVYFPM